MEGLVPDVGEAGQDHHQRHQPAQRQQQGGPGPGVAGEQELPVPDQIPRQEDQHAELGGPVLQ